MIPTHLFAPCALARLPQPITATNASALYLRSASYHVVFCHVFGSHPFLRLKLLRASTYFFRRLPIYRLSFAIPFDRLLLSQFCLDYDLSVSHPHPNAESPHRVNRPNCVFGEPTSSLFNTLISVLVSIILQQTQKVK